MRFPSIENSVDMIRRLARLLDLCLPSFERPAQQEAEQRFPAAPTKTRTFFRRRQTGEGRRQRSAEQRQPLEAICERIVRIVALIAARGLDR